MTGWFSILVFMIAAAIALLYNRLVLSRNRVENAWSDIDVQLQRRHDLIPNLVEAVQAYASYERATFEAVTELRAEAVNMSQAKGRGNTVDKLGEVEEKLSSGVLRLLAVAENYPDLKANDSFLKLQSQLAETENYLQFARRYYNGSVRDYNTMTETVPSNFVANWFRFYPRQFFQKRADEVSAVPMISMDLDNGSPKNSDLNKKELDK